MSEKLNSNHEYHKTHELESDRAHYEQTEANKNQSNNSESPNHGSEQSIDKILDKVHQEAKSANSLKHNQLESKAVSDNNNPSVGPISVGADLRKRSLKSNLKKIQKELPAPQKAFSKIVHQPIINEVSEVVGNTAARANSLLGGGLFSVLASALLLTACRYYGYRYNYLIGMVAFVGGFFLGLAIEGFITLSKKAKGN